MLVTFWDLRAARRGEALPLRRPWRAVRINGAIDRKATDIVKEGYKLQGIQYNCRKGKKRRRRGGRRVDGVVKERGFA